MCTRFVYHGDDCITGFNFDIDLAVWDHQVIEEKDRFYIGIKTEDGRYHSYHGIHRTGQVGTLLYVHGNPAGYESDKKESYRIADFVEQFIQNQISFDDALHIVKTKTMVYNPDATMQAMLSDAQGRVLIIEPGIGYREEQQRYSLITNESVLDPESTKPFIVEGDDRYEVADKLLRNSGPSFSIEDAFSILQAVKQEGAWATRVSFVYSQKKQTVYYVQNNEFDQIKEYQFPKEEESE